MNPEEIRAFEYFLHRAAPCLAAAQDGSFWLTLVPQVMRRDDAARNAVLAISHLYEHPLETSNLFSAASVITKAQSQALRWQSRSIKGFHTSLSRTHDKDQTELALLSCMLLTTIEFQQNNVHNAITLLTHGFDLACTALARSGSGISATIKDILVPRLARQSILMGVYGRLPPKHWFERFENIAPASTSEITSLTDARIGLYSCLLKAMEFLHEAHRAYMHDIAPELSPSGPLKSWQAALMTELRKWDEQFFLFNQKHSGRLTQQERLATTSMIMYSNIAYIWVSIECDQDNMLEDRQMHRFQRIVDCAQTLLDAAQEEANDTPAPFASEMGVIPALFFTGMKCRHPLIRRKMVKMLKRAPRQEALFSAEMNWRALEALIGVEEGKELSKSVAEGTWQGELPSQETRCNHVAILYELDGGKRVLPQLTYVRGYTRGYDGKPRMERDVVTLYPCAETASDQAILSELVDQMPPEEHGENSAGLLSRSDLLKWMHQNIDQDRS